MKPDNKSHKRTVIFMLILMVSPSLNPRSRIGFGSAFSFSSASAFFTYLKWSCSATLKSKESDRSYERNENKTINYRNTWVITSHPESDSDECRSPVIVLNAQHKVSRAVWHGLDGDPGVSLHGAVCEKLTRNFIFQFDVERRSRRHHSHSPIPRRFVQVPVGGSTITKANAIRKMQKIQQFIVDDKH